MRGLLDVPRSIVADLIRKRLWPIAVALLLALVAVPVVVVALKSYSEPPAPNDAVATAVTAPGTASASADPARAYEPERGGRVRDPFFDPPAPPSEEDRAAGKPSDAAGAAEPAKRAAAKPAAKSTGRADARPAAPRKAKPGPLPPTTPTGPPARRVGPGAGAYYRTAARLGAGSTTRPLMRLTPVGARSGPAALYLGVMKVGRPYAVFVLGRRATSGGDATCASDTRCRVIGLLPGDTQTITLHGAGGRPARRFVVHVTSLRRAWTTAAKAGAMRADVHPHGRSALRAMSRSNAVAGALGRLGYRRSSGLLYSIAAADALDKASG